MEPFQCSGKGIKMRALEAIAMKVTRSPADISGTPSGSATALQR